MQYSGGACMCELYLFILNFVHAYQNIIIMQLRNNVGNPDNHETKSQNRERTTVVKPHR